MIHLSTASADFAAAPVAPHSAQFPLAQVNTAAVSVLDVASPAEVRPWGLRGMRPALQQGDPVRKSFSYDHDRRIAVDSAGRTLTRIAPTANSVTNGDGDEGPSEDWTYDFAPDQPFET